MPRNDRSLARASSAPKTRAEMLSIDTLSDRHGHAIGRGICATFESTRRDLDAMNPSKRMAERRSCRLISKAYEPTLCGPGNAVREIDDVAGR